MKFGFRYGELGVYTIELIKILKMFSVAINGRGGMLLYILAHQLSGQ
jgi:hypothetical protein